ncbi:MAG: pyrroline-5-carboxylate reductase [Granulosicoccus sp.]|nr:pyrroline-5-carboxylate reductase [Granulosicoccus sp.]
MATEQKITFIGAGNMANSIIGGLIRQGVQATSITVTDPLESQRSLLTETYSVTAAADNIEAVTNADTVVLAVKPNAMELVCSEIGPHLPAASLLLSIAAGVRVDNIEHWSGSSAIVRCMPNTPALVGAGASALFASPGCTNAQRDAASSILSAAGLVCWVEEESKLDIVTALSGSGPAYFFHLIECMTQAATEMGLDAEIAESFAIETAFGAASMARLREASPATLRQNVTSKGGTTAAALASFAHDDLPAVVARAMEAARARAEEMSKG